MKTEWGADYTLMGDVVNGMKAWQSAYQLATLPNTLNVGHCGLQGNFELGLNLDQANAFSIEAQQISTQTESINSSQLGTTATYSVNPTLESVSLNYYRTLFRGGGFRTYAVIGGGYYHAIVDYYDGTGGAVNGDSATFTGDILGGNLGVGEEMEILTNLSLGLNVKGLLATFSQVSSNSINGFGQIYTDHAPYVLGIFTASGPMPGTISAYSVPFTGSMFRYAVVDFSGFTTNLNLAYHF